MTKKKLTIAQLLAKVEVKSRKRVRVENNVNVIKYIDAVGWEVGTTLIPTYVIFWHYRKQGNNNLVTKTPFFRTFNKRFPSYRKNTQRYYLLKEGIINITPELLREAKIYDSQYWKRKKKAKVQLSGQEGHNEN